jgi:ubiquinone/menaquinone biosynthesis C-methylase UbiE
MKKRIVDKIIGQTEAGYDQMAEKFSGTRSFFWPDLDFIKNYIKEGDRVLDFGCGNGRLLEILQEKKMQYYGVDVSQRLIALAQAKYPQWAPNFSKIPGQATLDFVDDFFDAVVSIAVFHHFPDKDFRLAMAQELARVTKPGGMVVVTVWNLWQEKYKKHIWKNRWRKLLGRSRLDWLDCEIPFKNNTGETFRRFHHAYTLEEMRKIFAAAGFAVQEARIVNNKNLVLIGKKILAPH